MSSGKMPFEADAKAQIARIRENLEACAQTADDEAQSLADTILWALAAKDDEDVDLLDIENVQHTVREHASDAALYLRGRIAPEFGGRLLLSTKTESGLLWLYTQEFIALGYMTGEAEEEARRLVASLEDPSAFHATRHTFSEIALGWRSVPMWLALSDSAVPPFDSNIELLPARLGLAPNSNNDYVLLTLINSKSHIPRFADSGAYPYWDAHGITLPIEQCPIHNSGLKEAVSEPLTVSALRTPLRRYRRSE